MKVLKEFGLTENDIRQILIEKRKVKPQILKRYLSDKTRKFGVVSDTHLCSVHEKLNELHTFYAICKKVGVKTILNVGDLTEGTGRIYRGQLNEIHTYGAKRQSDYVIENYPAYGIETLFITGNHDDSFFKENGIDIGHSISQKRKDLIYLGQYQADITLGKAKIRLLHHDRGLAYALSYHGQKIAEQIPSGQKPDILLLGHSHSSFYFFYRNIHILGCGCFQGQTSFLLRKGLNPAIGGWILEIREGKQDRVISLHSAWIPFFGGAK